MKIKKTKLHTFYFLIEDSQKKKKELPILMG